MKSEMTNNRISDGAYEKPSCLILKMIEDSMIAASPDPPTPISPPTSETDEVTDPNTAKEFKNFNPWQEWED